MGLKIVEHEFTGLTTPYTSYDSTKTNLGRYIVQKTGNSRLDKYVAPALSPAGYCRVQEMSGVATGIVYALDCQNGRHCIFVGDSSAAATTRRIHLIQYNKSLDTLTYIGNIIATMPSTGNQTLRGLAVARHVYTTGTVGVSGTAVTGNGTGWQTARYAVGARIGFGTTDPAQVTTWYQISAITNDTSITLQQNAGTITSGTSFVIEELRVYIATTNATATNGGLHVIKGITEEDFIHAGTTIPASTTVDNIKAVYFLKDATTQNNTVACGVALDTTQSDTSHFAYVLNADAGTTARIYKYDVRAALTVSGGNTTNAFVFRTGTQTTTGNIQNATSTNLSNNGIIATVGHSTGNGVKSFYFVTTTRIYRCAETSITNGGTTFLTDSMSEVPPGTTTTFAATSTLNSISYDSSLDLFVVTTASGGLMYITQYTSGTTTQFNRVFSHQQAILFGSAADFGVVPFLICSVYTFMWLCDGMLYSLPSVTTVGSNVLMAVPIAADAFYAVGGDSARQARLILPKFTTTGCKRFYRIYDNDTEFAGSYALGMLNEGHRFYYRTSGIDDDTGSWVAFDHDLTGVTPADQIQFMVEFRTIGPFCLSKRMYNFSLLYEDDGTDSHYEPSLKHSDVTNERFAWRFHRAFNSNVPTLTIKIYDAETNSLLITDDTATPTEGTWEKSVDDGQTWTSYNVTDKANEITYIRYTPTSLTDGIKALAILTQ